MQTNVIGLSGTVIAPTQIRREVRYRLNFPVVFSWESADRPRMQGQGCTRDISVLGAFILSPLCPPVETLVDIEILLPCLTGTKTVVRITSQAQVIRAEHPCGGRVENGFAVVRENMNQWSLTTSATQFELRPVELREVDDRFTEDEIEDE